MTWHHHHLYSVDLDYHQTSKSDQHYNHKLKKTERLSLTLISIIYLVYIKYLNEKIVTSSIDG